jgi:ketosteroid isomerase-like protein
MKRSIWVVAVLVLLAGYALASPMADDAAAVKGLASILADSVTLIGSDGTLRNKADALAAMNDRKYESAVEEELKVSVYGDAAVATGIWRAKGTEKGKPFEEVERFTDTYVKTGGQWKCVASHSSTMKAM